MPRKRLQADIGRRHAVPSSPRVEGRRSPLWFRWGVVGGGLGLFALFLTQVSWPDFGRALRGAHYPYVAAALGLGLVQNVLRVLRFNFLYPVHGRWLDAYGVFALLRPINYVMPFRSGDIVALGLLKKRKFVRTVAESSAGWLLMRACDLVALLALLTVVTATNVTTIAAAPKFKWVYLAIALTAGISFLAIPVLGKLLLHRSSSRKTGGTWLSRRLQDFAQGLRPIITRHVMAGTLGFSLLVWAANICMMIFALLTFHAPLTLSQCAIVVGLALTINLLPIRAPLGLGTGDAAWVAPLILFGIPAAEAIALALAVRLVQMLVTGVEGAVGFGISLRAAPA